MGLWYLKNLDGRIYIYVGDSRLKATYGTMKEIGCVLDVKSQTAGGCRTYIVFKALQGEQPRALKFSLFDKNRSFCEKLKTASNEADFCKIFHQYLKPYIDPTTGKYELPESAITTSACIGPTNGQSPFTTPSRHHGSGDSNSQYQNTSASPIVTPTRHHGSGDSNSQYQNTSASPIVTPTRSRQEQQPVQPSTVTPSRSRKRIASLSSPQPASKKVIENSIQKCFLGQFNLPIGCLMKPKDSHLVRQVDRLFVDALKTEMLANPTTDVAPMVALLRLRKDEEFDHLHPEAYTYETLGGNNSRTALSELLQENPELATDSRYNKRLVSVYKNLTDEQAQLLGVKHNRQQSFVHSTTTQDKVHLCRMKLFTSADKDINDDETPEGTREWRDGCAETLMTTKLKLTDNMIFLLAGLPTESYKILQQIFTIYEEQKSKHAAQSEVRAKPDCRGSNFRELRNLKSSVIHSVLLKVKEGVITLNELNSECKRLKRITQLKQIFAAEVGVESWEEAMDVYPHHATEAALQRFLSAPKLTGPCLAAFQQHCRKALQSSAPRPQLQGCHSLQSIEETINGVTFYCFHLAMSPAEMTYQGVTAILPNFSGIVAAVVRFDLLSDQQGKAVVRSLRAINRGSGLNVYSIFGLSSAENLSKLLFLMKEEGLETDTLYWYNPEASALENGVLKDVVVPVVLGTTDMAALKALACGIKRLVSGSLKDFFQFIGGNFTNEGDWILECSPQNGKNNSTVLMREKRNVLLVGDEEIVVSVEQ